MERGKLLTGGINELKEIKECLLELYGNQASQTSLQSQEELLENNIATMEKELAEEIQKTTKKRRSEIEDTFDVQIDKLRSRIKRIQNKREKRKSVKVSQRIDKETLTLRTENIRLKLEAKTLFRQKRIPRFCNSKLYYSLYSPSCFTDYLIVLFTLFLTLLAIPCGIYFFLLPEEKILYLILTYVITVILFGFLYVLIGSRTKERFSGDILKVKGIRKEIRANKRKMRVIRGNIRRDRDESTYELQEYDSELVKLEQEAVEVASQKKAALSDFDSSICQVIATEIESSYKDKLAALKAEYEKASAATKQADDRIKALSIKAASEYELLLGKEFMTIQKIDSLLTILQEGKVTTISEAIAYYRQNLGKDEGKTVELTGSDNIRSESVASAC